MGYFVPLTEMDKTLNCQRCTAGMFTEQLKNIQEFSIELLNYKTQYIL